MDTPEELQQAVRARFGEARAEAVRALKLPLTDWLPVVRAADLTPADEPDFLDSPADETSK